jgi:hypothetical protein
MPELGPARWLKKRPAEADLPYAKAFLHVPTG